MAGHEERAVDARAPRLGLSAACAAMALVAIGALVALPSLGALGDPPPAASGEWGRAALPAATPPTLLSASAKSVELAWAQPPPAGFSTAGYEAQVHGSDGQAVAEYAGAGERSSFAPLPPSSRLCARVRLRLQPGDVLGPWSGCAWVATSAPSAPTQMAAAWVIGSSASAVLVRWAPPDDGGLAVDTLELRLAALRPGAAQRCEWTGATCNAGCADLPAGHNWTLAESAWQGVFAECAGANELGCCGLQCWCHDHRCCEELPALLRAETRTVLLPAAATNATISVPAVGLGEPFALQLRAHNALGWAGWGEEARMHGDRLPAHPPDQPRLELVGASARALRVRWLPPEERGSMLLGYELQHSLASGSGRARGANASAAPARAASVLPASAASLLLPRLEPGAAYELRLRALSSAGPSAWSEPLRARTRESPPPEPPDVVRTAASLSDALVLAWLPPRPARGGGGSAAGAAELAGEEGAGADEVAAAVLEYEAQATQRAGGTNGSEPAGRCTATPPALGCTIGGLEASSAYSLRARSRSAGGLGGWSAPSLGTTASARGCLLLADHRRVLEHRASLHAALDRCSKDCWAAAGCVARCVARAGVSATCAACFGEVSACTRSRCLDRCALDPDGPSCRDCSLAECMADYAQCVGVPLALVP